MEMQGDAFVPGKTARMTCLPSTPRLKFCWIVLPSNSVTVPNNTVCPYILGWSWGRKKYADGKVREKVLTIYSTDMDVMVATATFLQTTLVMPPISLQASV